LPQALEADRIRIEIQHFGEKIKQYKASFRSRPFFKYATGHGAAYPALDAAAVEVAKLRKDCDHYAELASIFELTGVVAPITSAIKDIADELNAVKDVWDCAMLCELQFQVT
jgi:dynein heavy chain